MSKKHYREPVGHTCPDIDKIVSAIESVHDMIKHSEKYEEEVGDLKNTISNISHELQSVIYLAEKLRSCNEELRDWGISEAREVDKLEEQLELLQNVEA